MTDEIKEIEKSYAERSMNSAMLKKHQGFYEKHIEQERADLYVQIINDLFPEKQNLEFLEIGAGTGNNIVFFQRMGIKDKNIITNELIKERAGQLKINYPGINVHVGNAMDLQENKHFDIILQSTVFTSILSDKLKLDLANKMWRMLKPGGIILWYDFVYNNPQNKSVKGVPKKLIKQLFCLATEIKFYSVTLAPPIGRRIGKFYFLVNFLFPFLRTHVVAVIKK